MWSRRLLAQAGRFAGDLRLGGFAQFLGGGVGFARHLRRQGAVELAANFGLAALPAASQELGFGTIDREHHQGGRCSQGQKNHSTHDDFSAIAARRENWQGRKEDGGGRAIKSPILPSRAVRGKHMGDLIVL